VTVQVVYIKRRTPLPPVPKPAPVISRPPTLLEIAHAINIIRDNARRLQGVSRTNPHRFAEEKSELTGLLCQLEDAVRKGTPLPDRLKA
jgi:hypothetical protein